ncbi:imm11 family protein [Flavobacterium soli]|uniref:imm11 family protein n=1 Tax=Flavobacterium soli TaxID=344881 RepID=UPI00042795BA|nr:DUF1629 domain-containing protein [Flavobacterium soli]
MKYYRIRFTLNPKFRGSNDYIKDYKLKIPNNKLYWEEPKFIGSVRNEKIDFQPYLLDIELFASAKVNDLIMDGGPVSMKLILSGRLKEIIESRRKTGMQFFDINILKKDIVYNNFWLLNMYEFNQDYIDLKNSEIIHRKKKDGGGTIPIQLNIESIIDFENAIEKAREKLEIITIEKLQLNDVKEDFFILNYVDGGIGYLVSETLKQEIEDAGCTGIEFQPTELSYNEWIAPGGEREKVYGKL